jgi:hypothetical protein
MGVFPTGVLRELVISQKKDFGGVIAKNTGRWYL